MGTKDFYNPKHVTSPYGDYRTPTRSHAGTDYSHTTKPGIQQIPAIEDGVIVGSGVPSKGHGYGYYVDVRSQSGTWRYAHLDPRLTPTRGNVVQGQVLGYEGNTGSTQGVCVHVELFVNGSRVDPQPTITRITQTVTQEDEEMIQNIKGKANVRSGGTYLLKDGKATFLGFDPNSKLPYLEDEAIIQNLGKYYAGI